MTPIVADLQPHCVDRRIFPEPSGGVISSTTRMMAIDERFKISEASTLPLMSTVFCITGKMPCDIIFGSKEVFSDKI